MRRVPLVLVGFGNVGRAIARLILAKSAELGSQHGLELSVVGIATGRHGLAFDPGGLDLERALELAAAGRDLRELARSTPLSGVEELLERSGAEAALESIPVNYETGQPAIGYLRRALELGMHAITANKGPVVHAYRELTDLADRQGRSFRFESAVMDGAPIFSLWRSCLPVARLRSFRGILNSTSNLVLTLMEQGQSFPAAVAEAQRLGLAETDPSGDIEGWDAAVKVAALVTVLMESPIRLGEVQRRGIEGLSEADIRQAAEAGRRWKLVCSAVRQGDGVDARVSPELLEASDPLFHVMGTSAAVTFESDVLGPLTVREGDPGPRTTAYGMFADLLNCLVPGPSTG